MPLQGFRITQLREKLGLTQEDLAERVGTSQKQISKYESGAEPGAEKLRLLASALDTTSDYLLGLTDIPDRLLRASGDLDDFEKETVKLLRSKTPEQRQRIAEIIRLVS